MGFLDSLFGSDPSIQTIYAQDKIARENTFDPNEGAYRQAIYNMLMQPGGMFGNVQQGYQNLQNGELPAAYQQNFENAMRSSSNNLVGNMVNNLASRGNLFGGSTARLMNADVNSQIQDKAAQNFQNNIGIQQSLLGNQANLINNQFSNLRSTYEPIVNRRFSLQNDYIQQPGSQGIFGSLLGAAGTAFGGPIGGAIGSGVGNLISGNGWSGNRQQNTSKNSVTNWNP